jgi:drug/metabolite transporter (DMT)-like permease
MRTLNKPSLMLFIGILAVSTASIFIRNAQQNIPSTMIAAGRLGLATVILIPFCLKDAAEQYSKLSGKDRIQIMLAGLFLGFHFLVWIKSLELTSIASSVILVTTTPIWVALFSPLVLKEHITSKIIFGLTIAMGGIFILIIGPSYGNLQIIMTKQNLLGNFLALCGAWLAAAYTMVGRGVRDKLPLKSYVFLVYGVAGVIALLFAIRDIAQITSGYHSGFIWIFLLALIPQVIGHTLFNNAVRQMQAVYASIALLGEPVGSIILAWFFLHENPTFYDLIGGLFVLCGIFLALRRGKPEIQSLE